MTPITLRLSESNRRVAYQDHGKGEPIVLLHGVGMQSAAWAPQIATLKDTNRVIVVDLPGHGGSDPLPAASRLPDFVAWCSAVINELNLGPINLVGHSMGALIAAGYAVVHPDQVRRVALLNAVWRRDADASKAVISRAALIREGQVDFEAPLSRWFEDTPADAAARALVRSWLSSVNLEGYATAYTAFAHGDMTYAAELSGIVCPFLALTADGDLNSTPEMSQQMSAQALNGYAVAIKGHRHMVNLTAPDQVNAHLLELLSRPEFEKEPT